VDLQDTNFELKHLRSFLVVLEEKSFTRASRRLRLGQATISNHISQLEAALGTVLIERSSKGFSVTPRGELFREYCVSLFAGLDRFKGDMSGESAPQSFTVAASTVPGQYLFPRVLPVLLRSFPGMKFRLELLDSREAMEMVKSGNADLGLTGKKVNHPSLVYQKISGDSLILISSAKKASPLSPADLLALPMIGRERGSGTRESYDRALSSRGISPARLNCVLECTTTECVKQAVMAGVGMAFISSLAVQDELARGLLKQVPVKGLNITRDFHALWMKNHRHGGIARRIAAVIKEHL
jgi:DNA-binding transcriptional LysR family regulator